MREIVCCEENGGQALDYLAPFFLELGASLVVGDVRDHGSVNSRSAFVQDHGDLFFEVTGKRFPFPEKAGSLSELGRAFPADKYVFSHYYLHTPDDLSRLPGATVQTRHGQVNGCLSNQRRQNPLDMLNYDLFLAEAETYYAGFEAEFAAESDRCAVVGNIPASYLGGAVKKSGYVPRGFDDEKNVVVIAPSLADRHEDHIYRGRSFAEAALWFAEAGYTVVVRFHPMVRALYLAGRRFSDCVSGFFSATHDARKELAGKIVFDWRLDSSLKYLNLTAVVVTDYSSAALQFVGHGVPVVVASVPEYANFLAGIASAEVFPGSVERGLESAGSGIFEAPNPSAFAAIAGDRYVNPFVVEDLSTLLDDVRKHGKTFAKLGQRR